MEMRTVSKRVVVALLLVGFAACNKKDDSGAALAKSSQSDASGQTTTPAEGEVIPASNTTAAPVVDKAAVATLEKMGAYLRSLKAFEVRAITSRDHVLDNGQKVQVSGIQGVLVQRPNKFRGEVSSDAKERMFFYDGKNFTLYADRVGYYATVPAPGTLGELSDKLETKYGIELPLRDLFLWGTDKARGGDITSARDIGPSQVDGTTVEQYAFRQDGIDWQIWIQQGAYPLPRKLVITTTSDDARPDYSAVLNWNLAPSYNDAAFTFDAPAGSKRIVLVELDSTSK